MSFIGRTNLDQRTVGGLFGSMPSLHHFGGRFGLHPKLRLVTQLMSYLLIS